MFKVTSTLHSTHTNVPNRARFEIRSIFLFGDSQCLRQPVASIKSMPPSQRMRSKHCNCTKNCTLQVEKQLFPYLS